MAEEGAHVNVEREGDGKRKQRHRHGHRKGGEDGDTKKRRLSGSREDIEGGNSSEQDDRKRSSKYSRKRSRHHEDEHSETSSASSSSSFSSSSSSSSSEEYRRRKRREKKRRKDKDDNRERRHKKKKRKRRDDREKKKVKKGPVTEWGKFGIIKEIDMWNKRPEFSAWLAEVKQVNMETLPAWEEKQMFKEYMEDYNTATFPSKKYYDLDSYHRRKIIKEMEKGARKAIQTERIVFNDEEQRRQELKREREQQKEVEVEALKRSMQSGMAKAMKEQAQLREEMNYQYRLGNYEAAAAIQRRLDPDAQL